MDTENPDVTYVLGNGTSGLFGVADAVSLGLTKALREKLGVDCEININQTQYGIASVVGAVATLPVGGAGVSVAAKAVDRVLAAGDILPASTAAQSMETSARFAVNSAGEATMSLRAGSESMEVSEHAALRMTQRDVSIDAAEAELAQKPFQYFHQNLWKTGYYDPASGVFVGSANGQIRTVINQASTGYISNLKAAVP